MVGALAALGGPAQAQASSAKATTLTVCKHGCLYTTIQSAVDHSGRGATIDVKPGKYVEGVIVSGHKHDSLRIIGCRRCRPRSRSGRRPPGRGDNKMGAAFHDANGSDFFNDGSGHGTCFTGNGAAATFDTNPTVSDLYPSCPTTAGTGTVAGNPTQLLKLAAVVLAKPPTKQESFWHVHPHPARQDRKPYEG